MSWSATLRSSHASKLSCHPTNQTNHRHTQQTTPSPTQHPLSSNVSSSLTCLTVLVHPRLNTLGRSIRIRRRELLDQRVELLQTRITRNRIGHPLGGIRHGLRISFQLTRRNTRHLRKRRGVRRQLLGNRCRIIISANIGTRLIIESRLTERRQRLSRILNNRITSHRTSIARHTRRISRRHIRPTTRREHQRAHHTHRDQRPPHQPNRHCRPFPCTRSK